MSNALDALLHHFQQRRPLRAGSLIISLVGDAIMPRGEEVWLGSLIKALEPFGLNPRLTRTAIFRLAQEDWLEARQLGRKSYYRVTDSGRASFKQAFKRVYSLGQPQWDGHWTLVLLDQLDADSRKALRQRLSWLGLGSAGPQAMLHPNIATHSVAQAVDQLGLTDQVLISRGPVAATDLKARVAQGWDLQQVGALYEEFVGLMEPLQRQLKAHQLPPEQAFMARTLLIHDYRRVLLKDPRLPAELLPADWLGHQAQALCAELYRALWPEAEAYIDQQLETDTGPLPPPLAEAQRRFQG